jgi:hypothetical protein
MSASQVSLAFPPELAEFDGRKSRGRMTPEYSRSGAEAQRREEETCLSELREQSFNSSLRRRAAARVILRDS